MDLKEVLSQIQNNSITKFKGCLLKRSPYGGTLFQLGGEGVKKRCQMSQLNIPFY